MDMVYSIWYMGYGSGNANEIEIDNEESGNEEIETS